jgi:ABC-type long-subunit fatty acid transport system fused permease/ATPase subunit
VGTTGLVRSRVRSHSLPCRTLQSLQFYSNIKKLLKATISFIMSVRPHNWTAVGLIFTKVCIVHTKFCLKLDKRFTQIAVSFYDTVWPLLKHRGMLTVCVVQNVERRI